MGYSIERHILIPTWRSPLGIEPKSFAANLGFLYLPLFFQKLRGSKNTS